MSKLLCKFIPKYIFNFKSTIIPVVNLYGPIGITTPLRPGLTLKTLSIPLKKAFSFKKAPAIALIINSPGGSPVQSHLIYKRIRNLAKANNKLVISFVEDVAASGGYMIALAGDKIIADDSSIIGSIGVISAGFGFNELIKKIGVQRRVYTSGKNKFILDPFQPENPNDILYLKELQKEIHNTFIKIVKKRRKNLIKEDNQDIFTGKFWTGKTANKLGLIDALDSLDNYLRNKFGKKIKIKPININKGLFKRQYGVKNNFNLLNYFNNAIVNDKLTNQLISSIEERLLWSYYGM